MVPLETLLPKWILGWNKKDIPIFFIKKSYFPLFIYFCKDHIALQYKYLIDCTAIDYPSRKKRFVVVYNLRSILYKKMIRIKVFLDEWTPIPSLTNSYAGANWYEREMWDMFGIFVENHPDLRRLLTDYGFDGYPLRKDFPLSGYFEVFFDEGEKRVEGESVHIDQEYRFFDFSKPWDSESR